MSLRGSCIAFGVLCVVGGAHAQDRPIALVGADLVPIDRQPIAGGVLVIPLPVGVYSAGLKRRDVGYAVTIAGIQSVYQKACDVGGVDLVIVDEAHLIPPDGEGMYRTFLADMQVINPRARVIGLTATPYRMTTGMICAPDHLLNAICYEVGVRELIVQGYLSPLKSKAGRRKVDTSGLHIRGGEFIAGEVEALMDDDSLVRSAAP